MKPEFDVNRFLDKQPIKGCEKGYLIVYETGVMVVATYGEDGYFHDEKGNTFFPPDWWVVVRLED